MSYDHIAARLQCLVCKAESTDRYPLFQVRWTLTPESATYRPGDRVFTASPHRWGYYKLRDGDPFERLRIVDTWQCPACGNLWNWALTTLEDDGELIGSVESVELVQGLRVADYVTDQLRYPYPQFMRGGADGAPVSGWLERLIEAVEAGEGPAC